MDSLKPGDIVYLNSGSPPLTVIVHAQPLSVGWVTCNWFDGAAWQSGDFPVVCLTTEKPHDSE